MLVSFAGGACLFEAWWHEIVRFMVEAAQWSDDRILSLAQLVHEKQLHCVARITDSKPKQWFMWLLFFLPQPDEKFEVHEVCVASTAVTATGATLTHRDVMQEFVYFKNFKSPTIRFTLTDKFVQECEQRQQV